MHVSHRLRVVLWRVFLLWEGIAVCMLLDEQWHTWQSEAKHRERMHLHRAFLLNAQLCQPETTIDARIPVLLEDQASHDTSGECISGTRRVDNLVLLNLVNEVLLDF